MRWTWYYELRLLIFTSYVHVYVFVYVWEYLYKDITCGEPIMPLPFFATFQSIDDIIFDLATNNISS